MVNITNKYAKQSGTVVKEELFDSASSKYGKQTTNWNMACAKILGISFIIRGNKTLLDQFF